MKKLLLGLGTLASVAAPVAAVIACGSGTEAKPTVIEKNSAQYKALQAVTTEVTTNAKTLAPGAELQSVAIKGDDVTYTFSPKAPDPSDASDATDDTEPTYIGVRITLNLKSGLVTKIETAEDTAGTSFKVNKEELAAVPADSFKDILAVADFKLKAADLSIPELADTKAKDGATTEYGAVGNAKQKADAALAAVENEATLTLYKTALSELTTAIEAYNNAGATTTTPTNGPTTDATVTNPGGAIAGAKPAAVTKDLSQDDKALLDGVEFTAVKNDVLPNDPAKLAGDLKDFIDEKVLPFPDAVAGVTRTYSVTLNKPAEAEVTVTSTETASTARVSTSKFTIKGFIAEQALAKEIQRFLLATTGKKATDPTITPDDTVDADATLIPTTPFDLDDLSPAEDITLSNAVADTSTGSITADFSAALRGETITGTVKFTGWKSALSAEDLAKKAVADLKAEFKNLSADDLKTSESDELPSAHASDKTLSALGISHIPTTSSKDTITYALTSKDAAGEMDVVATITNGATTDTVTFTITGFQTTVQHDEAVALAAAQATIDTTSIDAPVAAITGAATDGSTDYAAAKTAYDTAKNAAKAATTSTGVKAQVAKMVTAAADAKSANAKQTTDNAAAEAIAKANAAKTIAIKAIDDEVKAITDEPKLHDSLLFGAIATAQTTATTNINAETTEAKVVSVGDTELANVKAAIKAYTDSKGTDAIAEAAATAAIADAQAKIDGVTEAQLKDALKVASGVKAKDAVKANVTGTIADVELTIKTVTKNPADDATDVQVEVTVSSSVTKTTPKDLTVTLKFEANPSAVVTKADADIAKLVTFGKADGKATLGTKPTWLKTLEFDGAATNLKDSDKVTVKVTYATGFDGSKSVEVEVPDGTQKTTTPTTPKAATVASDAEIKTALDQFKEGDAVAKAAVKSALAALDGITNQDVKVTIADEASLAEDDKVVITIDSKVREFDLTAGKWTLK